MAISYQFICCSTHLFQPQAQFRNHEDSLKQLNANEENLKRNLLDLKELKQILTKAQTFFQDGEQMLAEAYIEQAGIGGGGRAPIIDSKRTGKEPEVECGINN